MTSILRIRLEVGQKAQRLRGPPSPASPLHGILRTLWRCNGSRPVAEPLDYERREIVPPKEAIDWKVLGIALAVPFVLMGLAMIVALL